MKKTWPQKVSDIADSKTLNQDQKVKKLHELAVYLATKLDESTDNPQKKYDPIQAKR